MTREAPGMRARPPLVLALDDPDGVPEVTDGVWGRWRS